MGWIWTLGAVLVAAGSYVEAQIQSRPTDPPLVTAAAESWYVLREPVQFAGELYYPAGAAVFFNGNTMVRTGHYNGVPLYADTTIEPFSVILVPVSRGLLQPYERLRRGDLAGTTGSRPPAFPVRPVPESIGLPMAAVAPTAPPLPPGAISVYTPEPSPDVGGVKPVFQAPDDVPVPAVTQATRPAEIQRQQTGVPIISTLAPEGNVGVWVMFAGERWVSAGMAVPLAAAEFVEIGEYAGFPVFARREFKEEVIYLPSRAGLIAPYRLNAP